jgi:hypothetical protein
LIDGTPQILLPTAYPYKDLVQVPCITEPRLATPRCASRSSTSRKLSEKRW